MWSRFAKHHYLRNSINAGARIFVAERFGELIALCGVQQMMFPKTKQIARTVVLPDYQGIGVMRRLTTAIGYMLHYEGFIVRRTTSNPAIVHALRDHPNWRLTHAGHYGARITHRSKSKSWVLGKRESDAIGRATFSFVFCSKEVANGRHST